MRGDHSVFIKWMNDLHSLEVILSTLLILGIYFSYKMNLLFFFFLFSLLHDAYFLTLRHPSSTEVSLFLHSVQFSRSVVSNSLWPHESQHARPPCLSPTPGVHSDSSPLSQWCHYSTEITQITSDFPGAKTTSETTSIHIFVPILLDLVLQCLTLEDQCPGSPRFLP